MDLKALRELAEKAMPGKWSARQWGDRKKWVIRCVADYGSFELVRRSGYDEQHDEATMQHIAACQPATILDLIGRVEAAESFIEAFRQADLHCDVLGYITGDYNDDPVDGEGIAMADELRKLLSQKG